MTALVGPAVRPFRRRRTVCLPGVYRPQQDTWMLAEALHEELVAAGPSDGSGPRRVLELGAGSGAISAVAARMPGTHVTAVDVSRRALASTWVNGRGRVRVRRGDLTSTLGRRRFDVVVSNPPYVPAATDELPVRGTARAWDAGCDGRLLLDRICRDAPHRLAPGGRMLLVHSALNGVDRTVDDLAAHGLEVDVTARLEHPYGPVLRARAALLASRGLCVDGDATEELVVIRARRPDAA